MSTSLLPLTPPDGWSLDNLPADPPKHPELIRGTLVHSPETEWHRLAVRMLEQALLRQAPDEYAIAREIAVRHSDRTALEPDFSIIRAHSLDAGGNIYGREEVVLVAEVMQKPTSSRRPTSAPCVATGRSPSTSR
jgi:hypothetical protein